MTPRWATAGIFFVNGMGVGTLLPHLPYVREQLAISKGVLGLCLLAMTLGALIAMPIAGQLLDRRPSRAIVSLANCQPTSPMRRAPRGSRVVTRAST